MHHFEYDNELESPIPRTINAGVGIGFKTKYSCVILAGQTLTQGESLAGETTVVYHTEGYMDWSCSCKWEMGPVWECG